MSTRIDPTVLPEYARQSERAAHAASEAEDAIEATLSPDQKPLYDALIRAHNDEAFAGENRIIEELARHLPGLAPAIRALGYHHIRDDDDRDATCCVDGGRIRS